MALATDPASCWGESSILLKGGRGGEGEVEKVHGFCLFLLSSEQPMRGGGGGEEAATP